MPKQKRTFEIEVEAKIQVDAFDEVSAKKKIDAAFKTGHALGADVFATGHHWTYAVTKMEP